MLNCKSDKHRLNYNARGLAVLENLMGVYFLVRTSAEGFAKK